MKLSIITINYNNKNGLEQTIQSVKNQSFKDYEYIIVDGDSTDGSKEVLNKYKNDISYMVSEPDSGIWNAMNKGIKNAKGTYCLFLNSGDYLYNSDVLNRVFHKSNNSSLLYGNIFMEDGKGEKYLSKQPSSISLERLKYSTIYHSGCSFIKRDLFDKYGYYDESYKIVSDYYFTLLIILKYQESYQYIDEVISVFNTEGISSDIKYKEIDKKEREEVQLKIAPKIFWDSVTEKREIQRKYEGLMSSKSVRYALNIASIIKKNK